jgi:hypothetical protein
MSGHEVQADANLLSAFALMIGGALGVAFPMSIVIIWICSWQRFDIGALRLAAFRTTLNALAVEAFNDPLKKHGKRQSVENPLLD